eukprot:s1206_g23.t1
MHVIALVKMSDPDSKIEEVLKLSLDAAAGEHVDVSCAAEREQVFQILPGLFLGSEFGASNPLVIDSCNIRVIINLTSGHAKIPNQFEKCRYVNYELVDQPGEDILSFAIREGVKEIRAALGAKESVMVHCSAALSRSATVVVAYVMCYEGRNLSQAALAQWERELQENDSAMPTFDFTDWWIEVFGNMGIPEDKIRQALIIGNWTNFEKAFQSMLEP